MWCRVWCRLDLSWSRLLLKNWVVAKALALALLAVAADRVSFVALRSIVVSEGAALG